MASEAPQPQQRVTESGYVGIGAETHDELEDLDLYEALINPHDQSGGGKDGGRGGPMMMPPMGMAGGGGAGSGGGAGGMPPGIGANAMGAGAIGGMAGGKLPGAGVPGGGMPGGGMPGGGTMPAGGGGLGSSFAGGGGGGGTMAAGVGPDLGGGGGGYAPGDYGGGGGGGGAGYTPPDYGGSDGGGYTPPDYSRDPNLSDPPDYDTGKNDPYLPGERDEGDLGTTTPREDPTDPDLPDFDKNKYPPIDYETDLPDATTPGISDLPTGGGGGGFTPPGGIGGGGIGGGGLGGGGIGGIDGLTGEPTAEEIQVSVAALRTEADIWEDLADEYERLARQESSLEIATSTYGWINRCDAIPGNWSLKYHSLMRHTFNAMGLGETEFRAIAETLRTNADKYDETEAANEQGGTAVTNATGGGPVPTGGGMHTQQAV